MVSKINFSETKMMKELDALELREVGFAKEFAEHLEERYEVISVCSYAVVLNIF